MRHALLKRKWLETRSPMIKCARREKVRRNVCKDVPKKEEVMKEVEICVKTPKETCEQGEQLAPTTTCEKVKH